jgi:DNA-binding transcriptional LysR family regulator
VPPRGAIIDTGDVPPELRHLRILVAVAEERNFTRAAERLSFSQQAVSRAVAQLEDELGAALLERSTRDVALTRAGEALLAGSRPALIAIDHALRSARGAAAGQRGSVTVGVTPAIGPRVRTELITVLRARADDVVVALRELRPADLTKALDDRSVDIALVRSVVAGPSVSSRALTPTAASVYLPVEHPLAREPTVDVSDLDGERLMTWSSADSPFSAMLLDLLLAAGARVSPVLAPVTGGDAPPLLRETGTVALLPAGWPSGEATVERPTNPAMQLPLFVMWRSGTHSPWAERVVQGL